MGNCAACKDSKAYDAAGTDDATRCQDYSQVAGDSPILLNSLPAVDRQRQAASEGADREGTFVSDAPVEAGNENIIQELSIKESQLCKMAENDGFIAVLDRSATLYSSASNLKMYGVKENELSEVQLQEKVHAFRSRIMAHQKFDGERIIGCVISEDCLDATVCEKRCPQYLWEEKNIVPILSVDASLAPEQNGVQLMEGDMAMLDQKLTKAAERSVFGVKVRSAIKNPNAVGIKSLIDQQLQVCNQIFDKKLVPILQPEIQASPSEKLKCEQVLLDVLIDALDRLASDIKVVLMLTIPSQPNIYLPLTRHTNVLRLAAVSSGFDRSTSCKMISANVGMITSLSKATTDDLSLSQSDADFTQHLDASCQVLYQASHSVEDSVEKIARISEQPGFIILMTPFSISPMLSAADQEAPVVQDKMNELVKRIILNDSLNSARVVAMFMTIEFCNLDIDGMPASQYLWRAKGVIPLMIFSCQLEPESDGVQLMLEPPNFDEEVDKAVTLGAFSVQLRGMINQPNQTGVDKLVSQQFRLSMKMMEKGVLPNMMLEVKDCSEKGQCEELLLNSILSHLGSLTPEQKVTFTLTMPSKPNLYLPLVEHPNVLRVGAASRGYTCADACRKLSDNDKLLGVFGRAFTERLCGEHSEEEQAALVGESCKTIHQAVTSVSAKEEQMTKVSSQDGFFAILDNSGTAIAKCLKRYGIDTSKYPKQKDITAKFHQMFTRIVTDSHFDGSRVIGTVMSEQTMNLSICGLPSAKFLWNQKGTVPFLKVDNGLMPEANGVQLMQLEAKDMTQLMNLLDRAASVGIFGTKQRCFIKLPDAVGIKAAIDQQLKMARNVCSKGLLPMLQLEVDIDSPEKAACEQLLFDMLLDAIEKLRSNEKVVLLLTLPTKRNLYLSLMSHPNVLRLIAVSGGYSQKRSCKMLKTNINMIGGFGRAFMEGMTVRQKDKEFTKVLDQNCNVIFNASKFVDAREEQLTKLTGQSGFFVGFDQDLESMPKLLSTYGITAEQYADEAAMMEMAHQLHSRIVINTQFNGSRCLGIILTEYATSLTIARMPSAKYLWEVMRIVPFMKLDKGLAAEEDGVRQMKEVRHLRQKLDKAIKAGICGTITRSVIRLPNQAGIRSVVDQQIQLAKTIMLKHLVPILQIEIDVSSPDKARCERVLVNSLCRGLEELTSEQRVILDVTLPETPGTYSRLVEHPNVLRVAALSGGYKRAEAAKRLEQNAGMIASFGRAFAEGLHVTQTDAEFTGQIVQICKLLYNASRHTAAPEDAGHGDVTPRAAEPATPRGSDVTPQVTPRVTPRSSRDNQAMGA
mmetsp:Transcript_127207/g.245336  ORF Transcript_127207/g.245336 Transcript_127207/m.245336 type:complete len:1311 (+) Transcript_127207:109-4041(+)